MFPEVLEVGTTSWLPRVFSEPTKNPDTQSTSQDPKALRSFLGDFGEQCAKTRKTAICFIHTDM